MKTCPNFHPAKAELPGIEYICSFLPMLFVPVAQFGGARTSQKKIRNVQKAMKTCLNFHPVKNVKLYIYSSGTSAKRMKTCDIILQSLPESPHRQPQGGETTPNTLGFLTIWLPVSAWMPEGNRTTWAPGGAAHKKKENAAKKIWSPPPRGYSAVRGGVRSNCCAGTS